MSQRNNGGSRAEAEEKPTGPAQERIPCAPAGVVPSEVAGVEDKDGSTDHGKRAARGGQGVKGKRNRAAFTGDKGVKYRPIPSRPHYFAGTDGSIWSNFNGRPRKRKLTKVRVSKNDVRLYVSFRVGGKPVPMLVNRLVAQAFHGPCPDGLECCHENGNGLDNRPENLRWDTHQSNMDDKIKHGTAVAVVTPELALRGVEMHRGGMSAWEVAKALGLKPATVWSFLSGRSFSHITGIPKRVDRNRQRK